MSTQGVDGSVVIEITADETDFDKKVNKVESAAKAAGAAIGVSFAAASAAVAKISEEAVKAYSDYEQLIGGVETLFGAGGMALDEYAASVGESVSSVEERYNQLITAQTMVIHNADEAYKNAGLSANKYMDTVTGFSAALIESLNGDTVAAAGVADMAVTDMADNANKMGTAMESIQNAYQGFAKQNYTMLDNLKLGYGGTKAEMERLLEKASELSGLKFDISNFSDVVQAIHVIQDEIGITGTTQKEAASTIQGSISTMKAAWENALTGMADDNQNFGALIDNLSRSILTVADNVIPRFEAALPNMADGIEQLVDSLLPRIPETVNKVLPEFLTGAEKIMSTLLDVLASSSDTAAPIIAENAKSIVKSFVNGISDNTPVLISSMAKTAITVAGAVLDTDNIEVIVNTAADIIEAFAKAVSDNLPILIPTAVKAVLGLASALLDNIEPLINAAEGIIKGLTDGLTAALPELLAKGPEIVIDLIAALVRAIPDTIEFAVELCERIGSNIVNYDWESVGSDMYKNLYNAIENALHGDSGYVDRLADEEVQRISRYSKLTQEQLDKMIADNSKKLGELNNMRLIFDNNKEYDRSLMPKWMLTEMDMSGETSIGAYLDKSLQNVHQTIEDLAAARKDAVSEIEKLGLSSNFGDGAAKRAEEEAKKHFGVYTESKQEAASAVQHLSDEEAKHMHYLAEIAKESGEITEEEYYNRIESIASQLDEESKLYEQYNKEVISGRRKLADSLDKETQNAYKTIYKEAKTAVKNELTEVKKGLKELVNAYKDTYDDIIKNRDSYKSRLMGENVFSVLTETDKETGAETTTYSIDNLSKRLEERKKYANEIDRLQKRGMNKNLLSELESLDMEQSMTFAKQINKMSDEEFEKLNSTYNELDKATTDLANARYANELERLQNGFISEAEALFEGMSVDLKQAGMDGLMSYIEGFDVTQEDAANALQKEIDGVIDNINSGLSANTVDISDTIAQTLGDTNIGESLVDNIVAAINDNQDSITGAIETIMKNTGIDLDIKSDMESKSAAASQSGYTAANNVTASNNTAQTATPTQSTTVGKISVEVTGKITDKGGRVIADIVNKYNNEAAIMSGG